METLVFSPVEFVEGKFTKYELPPEGISMLGYVVRRMHKTELLNPIAGMLKADQIADALCQVGFYTASAAVSFGKLNYEPHRDQTGATITERDPETNALVTATLDSGQPTEQYSYKVRMPGGETFTGLERSGESRFSIRGLAKPAETKFKYVSLEHGYKVWLTGTITRELVPTIVGPSISRAHGCLEMTDTAGNKGHVTLHRDARAIVTVSCCGGRTITHRELKLS